MNAIDKVTYLWQQHSTWQTIVELARTIINFLCIYNYHTIILSSYNYQEYIIEREGEYPTPVYHSVVSLDRGHDLYNVIHTYHSRPHGGGF